MPPPKNKSSLPRGRGNVVVIRDHLDMVSLIALYKKDRLKMTRSDIQRIPPSKRLPEDRFLLPRLADVDRKKFQQDYFDQIMIRLGIGSTSFYPQYRPNQQTIKLEVIQTLISYLNEFHQNPWTESSEKKHFTYRSLFKARHNNRQCKSQVKTQEYNKKQVVGLINQILAKLNKKSKLKRGGERVKKRIKGKLIDVTDYQLIND